MCCLKDNLVGWLVIFKKVLTTKQFCRGSKGHPKQKMINSKQDPKLIEFLIFRSGMELE